MATFAKLEPYGQSLPAPTGPRVGALRGLLDELADWGAPPHEVVRDAGLPRELFKGPDNRITYRELQRLYQAASGRTQCAFIGLLAGLRTRLADLGLLGELVLCFPTVGSALDALANHFDLHDPAAVYVVIRNTGQVRLVCSFVDPEVTDSLQVQFSTVAMACRILQELCGPEFRPSRVSLACRAPCGFRAAQNLLKGKVNFDAPETSITFPASWLARPLAPVAPERRARVRALVAMHSHRAADDLPSRVRRTMRRQLLMRSFTMQDVASSLGMHRRTLDRHLRSHGLQYNQLLESVKGEMACRLLRETTMPIQQVADCLRFSSAANFATAFRRSENMTPSEFRRNRA